MTGVATETAERRAAASDWFVELYFTDITAARLDAFEEWIADPQNEAAFTVVRGAWDAAGQIEDAPAISAIREELRELKPHEQDLPTKLHPANDTGDDSPGPDAEPVRYAASHAPAAKLWPWAGAAIAACLALFLIIAPIANDSTAYATAIGERLIVTLDDGSVLELDAASRATVAYSGGAREITLEQGRANFEVAKGDERPFAVRAGTKLFVATGTEFSVELVNGEVRAVLYEGSVDIANGTVPASDVISEAKLPERKQLVSVAKGQQYIAPAKGRPNAGVVAPIPAIQSTAGWRRGRLEFAGEPLSLAVARINRYSRTKVVLDAPAAANNRVSGTFKAGRSVAFADGVAELYDLKMTRRPGEIVLSQ